MKLTNVIRDAFVHAVMDDVPSTDYDTQMRDLAVKKAIDRLPKKIQEAWKSEATRQFIKTGGIYVNHKMVQGIPGADSWNGFIGEEPPKDWFADLNELEALASKQAEERSELEQKVHAVAYSCTTRKALLEQLPEFEKYLPAEAPKASNLPAVANLVTDLLKAGWPKGGKKAKVEEPVAA